MATTKRKLPVLNSGQDGGDEPRPPWHWVGFGTAMIFTAWVPLAYVGAALVARSQPAEGAPQGGSLAGSLLAMVAPLIVATLAGGFLVGRFGKPAGLREALLSGLTTGLVAVLMTALSGSFSPLFLLVVGIAVAFAGLGGALGVRKRPA